jgi:DNA-binding transcriptional LysR family regulator
MLTRFTGKPENKAALVTTVPMGRLAGRRGLLRADDRIYESIAAGKLKRVLADWSPTFPGLFLYYSNRQHAQPVLKAFIDCLLDRRPA